jgi:chaperonin cofactor prefoldin
MTTSLEDRYKHALEINDLSEIQDIISELNSLPALEKKTSLSLYKQIGDDLFDNSSEISNYDLSAFTK